MYEGLLAETVQIVGHRGDQILAYLARPLGAGPFPGVIVVHHMPGWDDATKEITRRFAAKGYVAICPHLHHRDAPGETPDEAAAASRANGGVPDERFLGDADGAMRYVRSLTYSNRKVGMIGYCSGGRQAFLAACNLDLDAAIDCYGGWVAAPPPQQLSLTMQPILDKAAHLRCPVLGLFGAEDSNPSPAEVSEIAEVLRKLNKVHQFHTYQGAGHGFFSPDRPSYRVEAAKDGWARIDDWFGRYLT